MIPREEKENHEEKPFCHQVNDLSAYTCYEEAEKDSMPHVHC